MTPPPLPTSKRVELLPSFSRGTHKRNATLISEFERLTRCDQRWMPKEEYRKKNYARQVEVLKSLDFDVTSSSQIAGMKFMGPKALDKVDAILTHGYLPKRFVLEHDVEALAMARLEAVWGVGPTLAKSWYDMGLVDIASVRQAVQDGRLVLNAMQKIGVDFYEDLQLPVEREEMEAIKEVVVAACKMVMTTEELMVELCGSYRRGKSSGGDVDIIICDQTSDKAVALAPIVALLAKQGFLLSVTPKQQDDEEEDQGGSRFGKGESFMGVFRLRASLPARRIDIKVYKRASLPYALIYFTGPKAFNVSFFEHANKLGYKMRPTGLLMRGKEFTGPSDHPHHKVDFPMIELDLRTEEDVFRFLNLVYVPPSERTATAVVELSSSR
jgi:DNA polymerase lambda